MPTAYHVTGAFVGNGGAFIAEYGGNLFVVALSAYAVTSSDHSTIGIFKSTDDGATWTQVGSEITLPSSDDSAGSNIPVGDSDFLHGCLDINFPTDPYGYIVHANADHEIIVSRVNYSAEDFDDTSDPGPAIQDPSESGNHNFLGWMIEQGTDGDFGILANLNSAGADTDRVYAMSLSADLGTWSARTQVAGQTSGISYVATSIARGVTGFVHGFVGVEDGLDNDMYHTMVIGGGGGVGSALEHISEGQQIFRSPYCGALTTTGDIAFLFAAPNVGVGTFWKLAAAHAASADPPVFTLEDIDTTASLSNLYWAAVDGAPAGTFRAGYNVNDAEDALRASSYDAGTWFSPIESVVDGIRPFLSARTLDAGVGFTFGNAAAADSRDLYFVFLPVSSATTQTITGIEPIPTGEKLHTTHGVTGGGLDCGTNVPVIADNTCNPVDPDDAVDAPAECVPQGFSY